ncbi:hypothetical protein MCUN1_001297 [Malassezia cuniculi]|uniref:Mitochondrial import inner membrane translocase subunit Tim21 n=1 Tax=Malassezia cuniculi TaxID=948313 RepID=A0AAF0JAM4_9BASI|nr:hypothetical protein MCUN1_001297 [Malassezia cuniculi]
MMLATFSSALRSAPRAGIRCSVTRSCLLPINGVRFYSQKEEGLSKEQAELLHLLRAAAQKEKLREEQVSLGLAGVALSQGASSGSGKIAKWTGEGKKWSDISAGQKVARATVNTSRFFFISAGAALTFVIVYALSSELFAKNSPTVIYGEACKLIENSGKIHAHLLRPYRFQTNLTEYASHSPLNPPGHLHRPSQTVSSVEYHDEKTGRDMMFVHFFIESREKDTQLSYWQHIRGGIISGADWIKEHAVHGMDLIEQWWSEKAAEIPHGASAPETVSAAAVAKPPAAPQEPWWITRKLRSAVSGVGSLIGTSRDAFGMATAHLVGSTAGPTEPGTWSSGEVHIELVKDENGRYQYRRFFVDIPSTRAALRSRVWLDRSAGDLPTR